MCEVIVDSRNICFGTSSPHNKNHLRVIRSMYEGFSEFKRLKLYHVMGRLAGRKFCKFTLQAFGKIK